MDCTTSHIISTTKCWQKQRLKYTLVNCYHDLRDRENSYIFFYFLLTILPSANSCHYWGTEIQKNFRTEACNTFTFPFSQLRDANPNKILSEHILWLKQCLGRVSSNSCHGWRTEDGKNARTEACLACAGPCVATGLIWPLWLAWVGSLWPDLPAWVSVAWVCESCFMLLTGPLTCLTITLDRHHNPMFALLTKGCKEIQRHVHIFNRYATKWNCYTTDNIPDREGAHFLISTSITRLTCQMKI